MLAIAAIVAGTSLVASRSSVIETAPSDAAPPSTAALAAKSPTVSNIPTQAWPIASTIPSAPTSTDGSVVAVLALLDALPVAEEQPDGYDRDLFEHWINLESGCSTRQQVLIDESLSLPQVDPYGCTVVAGDWRSVYDGANWSDPSDVDIDHVVALKEAWESGAWSWDPATRRAFANDLDDPRTLRAVTDEVNQSKSDADPTAWLPPLRSFWCKYVADWVAIKTRWGLTVDWAEADVLRQILTGECSGTTTDIPEPAEVELTANASPRDLGTLPVDVYYANCSEVRAAGAAPLYLGEPGYRTGLDRDLDGVACET